MPPPPPNPPRHDRHPANHERDDGTVCSTVYSTVYTTVCNTDSGLVGLRRELLAVYNFALVAAALALGRPRRAT